MTYNHKNKISLYLIFLLGILNPIYFSMESNGRIQHYTDFSTDSNSINKDEELEENFSKSRMISINKVKKIKIISIDENKENHHIMSSDKKKNTFINRFKNLLKEILHNKNESQVNGLSY